jgi:hypothetical protein
LASQIQDLDVFLNEGWIRGDEVWEMATEFNHYVMRQIDRCIDNSHFRLWNLPALSSLRLKIEFFLIENYNGYEIRNANKPVNHQFNKIKEHSFYLFEPVSPFRSPYRGETPEIIERNDDPLHEFNELFGTQFVNGGGFTQQDFKKEFNSASKDTTEIFENKEEPLHEFNNHFGTQFVNEGVFTQQDFKEEPICPIVKTEKFDCFSLKSF